MTEREDGQLLFDIVIQYEKTAVGWLPAGWTATRYNLEVDRVEWVTRARVRPGFLRRRRPGAA
jgi:hypothetical protein